MLSVMLSIAGTRRTRTTPARGTEHGRHDGNIRCGARGRRRGDTSGGTGVSVRRTDGDSPRASAPPAPDGGLHMHRLSSGAAHLVALRRLLLRRCRRARRNRTRTEASPAHTVSAFPACHTSTWSRRRPAPRLGFASAGDLQGTVGWRARCLSGSRDVHAVMARRPRWAGAGVFPSSPVHVQRGRGSGIPWAHMQSNPSCSPPPATLPTQHPLPRVERPKRARTHSAASNPAPARSIRRASRRSPVASLSTPRSPRRPIAARTLYQPLTTGRAHDWLNARCQIGSTRKAKN
ncbi:hypothetical protein BC628DRAFT_142374 [Trametes gibbosa]|nr:hypothetical protein BC628DRAFT_142374 [Trametes gibbosa]